ncbi:MAG: recombinase family protein [Pseudomonadota bacterium]
MIRCAIYTRKSSEEGLDQDFNSLDAQREACASYIASQKAEGWRLLPDRYDDGGVSGGTLERPALQRLIADMADERVDLVVVYKIDRLTRSLADFAKLVERFDAAGASFVSVTQAFNTATSMGRLTLNVLLSFAQFEREVTAERIRDKIAASKKKGLWIGGQVPLGYDVVDRALVVNAVEAEVVRTLFERYLAVGTVPALKSEADRRALRTKPRRSADGSRKPGVPFTRGRLHHLLTNPIYVGRIRHGETTYDGAHDAIIDEATWTAVQAQLIENAAKPRTRHGRAAPSPLAGKLIDETGDRLTATHSNKTERRYRYYVSNRLIGGDGQDGWRLSASTLERAAADAVAGHLRSPIFRAALLNSVAAKQAAALADKLDGASSPAALGPLVASGIVEPDELTLTLNGDRLAEALGVDASDVAPSLLTISTAWTIKRRGVETKLVFDQQRKPRDPVLVKTIAQGRIYLDGLKAGRSIAEVARDDDVSPSWVARHIDAALLAPDIVERVLDGDQPADLSAATILEAPIPACWDDQRRRFGFAA